MMQEDEQNPNQEHQASDEQQTPEGLQQEPSPAGEYQYSGGEEDFADLYGGAQTAGGKSGSSGFNRRRLFTIIIAIVVIFILYKLATLFMVDDSKSTKADIKSKVTATKTVTPLSEITKTEKVKSSSHIANLATLQTNTPGFNAVQQPTTHLNNVQEQVKNMSSQLNQMNSAITNLTNSMSSITNALANISNNLQTISEKLNQRTATRKVAPRRRATKRRRVRHIAPNYYVQALIPGRAWLKGPSGGTLSVGVGDRIPGLGIVNDIDVQRGAIVTSSGAEIRYGIREN